MTVRLCYRRGNGVASWWNNMVTEVHKVHKTPNEVWFLLRSIVEDCNGKLVHAECEIEFENNEDATAFVLRWA